MPSFSLIYSFLDDKNKISTTEINVPTTFNLSQYTEFGAAMATILQNLAQGKLVSADLCLQADISGLTSNAATVGSTVDLVGAFQFGTDLNNKVAVTIPCLSELFMTVSGSDDLDQTQADVAAFLFAMTDGIVTTGGTILPCDKAEEDITSIDFAREGSRPTAQRKAR